MTKNTNTTANAIDFSAKESAKNTIIDSLKDLARADVMSLLNQLKNARDNLKTAQNTVDSYEKAIKEREEKLEKEIKEFLSL